MSAMAIMISLHLIGVVWWIGGLAFVSTVILPELRRDPSNALARFHAFEHRFAPQVRFAVLLVGATGGWLLYRSGLWRALDQTAFWWLDAMLALWLLFFMMLFVLGPTDVLRRIMSGPVEGDLAGRLARMHHMHVVLLVCALVTIFGAAAGAHGFA